MSEERASRRDVIRAIAAAGAAGAAIPVLAQVSTQPTTSQSAAATQPATPPVTQPTDPLTVADVAAADKVAAREYATDEQRAMMLESLESYRKRLRAYRERKLDPTVEPAVRFEPRLPETKVPSGQSWCALSDGAAPDLANGDVESLAFATVADLSRLLKARKVTSTQLTRMYLDRLKKYGPRLLCVVTLTEELALKQAARADEEIAAGKYRGPLHGVPYGAKDLLATKGIPTTYGVSVYKDQVLDYDATVVAKLEEAGAVLLAKLSLGELAMGDVWFGGKTRSPWDSKEGSSGSSAGPAAATAAGLVGFSVGSETLGSIISPCVQTGVTGLRPTWGRVSRYGALPLTWTLDKLGPMCRGVEDCALVLHALHGADPKDPTAADVPFVWDPGLDLKTLRIGYDARAFDWDNKEQWKDESLKQIYRDALDKVRSVVGAEMKPVTLPPAKDYAGVVGTLIAVESSSAFGDLLTSGRINELVQQEKGSWPNTFRVGATVPAADYLRVQRLRTLLMRDMHEALKDVDCYVTVPYAGPTLAFTNLCGQPSLITRCGTKDGRPKMIEFIGNLYREDAILRLALAYEQVAGWREAHPDVEKLPEKPE